MRKTIIFMMLIMISISIASAFTLKFLPLDASLLITQVNTSDGVDIYFSVNPSALNVSRVNITNNITNSNKITNDIIDSRQFNSIQDAINATTPNRTWIERVYIKGNYLVNDSILVPSYTHLIIDGRITANQNNNIGPGCAVIQSSGLTCKGSHQESNNNIIIEGGIIDGNKAGNRVAYEGMFLAVTDNFIIRNTQVINSPENGITLYPSNGSNINRGLIDNVYAYNNTAMGLQIEMALTGATGTQITIRGGEYYNNSQGGIEIKSSTTYAEPPYNEFLIEGVRVYNNMGHGISVPAVGQDISNVKITNSWIHNNSNAGISMVGGLSATTQNRFTVQNNNIYNNGWSGIQLWHTRRNIVSGNTIWNNDRVAGAGATNNRAGIEIVYSNNDTIVTNNNIRDETRGIYLNENYRMVNVTITNNNIASNGIPYLAEGSAYQNLIQRDNFGVSPYNFGNYAIAPIAFGMGDTYYNTTANRPCFHNNTVWVSYYTNLPGC